MENGRFISGERTYTATISAFMSRVYMWMFIGLFITAIAASITIGVPSIFAFVYTHQLVFWGLIIAEFVLVFSISGAINRISASTAGMLFITYSILNGVLFSSLFLIYTSTSIALAFLTASAMFLVMSIYGLVTKKDLTSWGSFLFMGLVGIIIAALINIFLKSPMMNFVISGVGVIVFTGLTAYDNQRLKKMGYEIAGNGALAKKMSVVGALMLYLDFINLFIMLLNLFGERR